MPTDWDETAFDLTDDSLERAIELRRIAMSTGEVIRSDEFRISVVPVWNESTPTISVSIAEWRELADVLVVVENVEPGTTGTPGQDWCLSVFESPTSYEDTVDLVEDVSA